MPRYYYKSVGEILKNIRISKNTTQGKFSKLIDGNA